MTMRKMLAVLLALSMVLSIPLAVSADGWELDCNGWWTAHSEPVEITETVQSWTFTATSYAEADQNFHTPSVVVWSGAAVNGDGYVEEGVIRSDAFGWAGVGSFTDYSKVYPADWAAWLAANKAGAACTVTAQLVGDQIVVGINNGGVIGVYYMDNNSNGNPVKLSLTGEKCKITGWTSTTEHVDISACVTYLKGETEWSVVNTTLGAAKSEALLLTQEPKTWTFISTTNADAGNNWDTAAIDVSSSAAWELTIRSDCFAVSEENGWGTAGEDAFGGKAYPADWAAWLEANKAGAACKVTAQVVDGTENDYIVVAFSNNGVVNTYIVPTAGALDSVKLYLTGENSVLTKLAESAEHIDISAAVESVSPQEQPEDPTDPTEPSEPEEAWVVDCPTWWGGHSAPVEVTEQIQSWTFINTSYASASDNWDTATVVVWRSDDGTMTGANYLEELLARSDSYAVSEEAFWGTNGQPAYSSKNYPADWAEWLAANKAGAECTVTAQIVDGWIVLGFSNNGVVNVYSVPMNKNLTSPVYLSLTGEECTMTGWKSTDKHLDISEAASAPSNGNPPTGDLLPIAAVVVALLSVTGIAVVSKKRMAI